MQVETTEGFVLEDAANPGSYVSPDFVTVRGPRGKWTLSPFIFATQEDAEGARDQIQRMDPSVTHKIVPVQAFLVFDQPSLPN